MIDFMIGTPYSFRSFNCWDYVSKVRDNNSIKTKLFNPKSVSEAYEVIKSEMQKLEHGLTLVTERQNFDIVITKKGKVYHCGLFFDGSVMHCSRPLRQVVKESFTDFIKPYESYTLWR